MTEPESLDRGSMTRIKVGAFQIVEWMDRSTAYLWADNGHHAQRDIVKVSSQLEKYVQLCSANHRVSM